MSIATQSLKYGWKVLAILTIGAGSIFVADNVLNRITTRDRIEVTLAVVERCLGTQYGTNGAGEPLYRVDPPSIVRTWTDTNGASVIVTNAIAWRDDLSMKVELDAKLEALCPYYVDANSVYDGTTNIVMHTFTGLLTSLDLGDHTNFTAIPAIGTNIATYGPWAWRNYVVAWQERYKVLEALKMTKHEFPATVNQTFIERQVYEGSWTYADLYSATAISLDSSNHSERVAAVDLAFNARAFATNNIYYSGYMPIKSFKWPDFGTTTQLVYALTLFFKATAPLGYDPPPDKLYRFDDNGYGFVENAYNLFTTNGLTTNDYVFFNPGTKIPESGTDPMFTNAHSVATGFRLTDFSGVQTWQFNYATNKYW